MTRTIAILALCLTACARPAVLPDTAFRNPAAPISSIAFFEPNRIDGAWREVAGYALPGRVPCRPGSWIFSAGGTRVSGAGCFLPLQGQVTLAPSGPGRMRAGGVDLWVLWVDADDRTLVLGTPSGSYAAILDRSGTIPPDRLAAARKILQFNGYDLARLATPG